MDKEDSLTCIPIHVRHKLLKNGYVRSPLVTDCGTVKYYDRFSTGTVAFDCLCGSPYMISFDVYLGTCFYRVVHKGSEYESSSSDLSVEEILCAVDLVKSASGNNSIECRDGENG